MLLFNLIIETDCNCKSLFRLANNTQVDAIALPSSNRIIPSSCLKCPDGTVSSFDRRSCMTCSTEIDPITNDCKCAENQFVEENPYENIKYCKNCTENETPAPLESNLKTYCFKCPEGQFLQKSGNVYICTCFNNYVKTGSRCFPQNQIEVITSRFPSLSGRNIVFKYLDYSEDTSIYEGLQKTSNTVSGLQGGESTNTVTTDKPKESTVISDLIDYLYLDNANSCLNRDNSTACQVVANLCVLQMYNEANPICSLYNTINNSKERYDTNAE